MDRFRTKYFNGKKSLSLFQDRSRNATRQPTNKWPFFEDLISDLKKTHHTRLRWFSNKGDTGYRRWQVLSDVLLFSDNQVERLDLEHLESVIVTRMDKLYPHSVIENAVNTENADANTAQNKTIPHAA